jgi:L-malate glycosyltransferase
MRICYISVGTFPHIDPYLEYFHKAGHDVHFISLSPGPDREVPTYNAGFGSYCDRHGKWKYPFSMLRARKLLRQIKPDIVHAHYVTSAGLAALVSGFHPAVITVHGSDLITTEKSRLWRPVLKRVFQSADCVNVVSQELSDIAVKMGVDAGKIEVLTHGIDTNEYTYTKKDRHGISKPLKLVCTRRLEPVFDHRTIIQALAILRDKKIQFKMTFIGGGSLTDLLKQQVKNLGLESCIEFSGGVSNNKMPELLADNDVYLSASLWDGASLSLFEAMATGLFPIVSDIKANSAWLRQGIDGFLHKVGIAEELANCIQRFIAKPDVAIVGSLRNREIVVQNADRNTNMRRLVSVYNELIHKAR